MRLSCLAIPHTPPFTPPRDTDCSVCSRTSVNSPREIIRRFHDIGEQSRTQENIRKADPSSAPPGHLLPACTRGEGKIGGPSVPNGTTSPKDHSYDEPSCIKGHHDHHFWRLHIVIISIIACGVAFSCTRAIRPRFGGVRPSFRKPVRS